MKTTDRDKTLILIIPSLVLLLGYGLFVWQPKQKEWAKAEKALRDASASVPSEMQVRATHAQLKKLSVELESEKVKLKELQEQWRASLAFCSQGAQRSERLQKLATLLQANEIRLLDDREADPTKDGKLAAAWESMAQQITQLSDGVRPQLRRLRLQGRYSDVHNALEQLSHGTALTIPLSLTMTAIQDSDQREWVLFVWI